MTIAGWFIALEARPGKEDELAALLSAEAVGIAVESTARDWFALHTTPNTFAVFVGVGPELARAASVQRELMEKLSRHAGDLLVGVPTVASVNLIGGSATGMKASPDWSSSWVGSSTNDDPTMPPVGWSAHEWSDEAAPFDAAMIAPHH